MDSIQIKFGSTDREVSEALDLYSSSFPGGYESNISISQNRARILYDDYVPARFVVAIKEKKVIACLRYSIRKIRLGTKIIDIVGVSDYCVNKSEIPNRFYGVTFLNKSLAILSKLNYPLGIGSGRKVMENYYSRFGFITASTYAKCYIEKIPPHFLTSSNTSCQEGFISSRIPDYENARICTTKNDWSFIYRSEGQWKWIQYQISELNLYKFIQVMSGNNFIGYFIFNKNEVFDFGFLPEYYNDCCVAMIKELLQYNRKDGLQIALPISFDNPILMNMKGLHFRFEHRCVPDEGVMTVPLNSELLLKVFSDVSGFSSNEILKNLFGIDRQYTSPQELNRSELSSVANALFMGTAQPFFLGNSSINMIGRTFNYINMLDAL